ncbi:hypothetical protein JXA31_00750 [Candidatus Bathyarchaeota archaeon]|nr:hypothetical protein [Candidatus Bathyarchaeota archaeon]
MKIEKKLIASSILALIIGVSSVVPMLFLMSGTAKAETTPKPWFNLNVPYAYLTANSTLNLNGKDIYNYYRALVFNFTLNPEAENDISDAQFEYYELQLYTDKEQLGNVSYFVGTNRTNSFQYEADSFHFIRDPWFDSNTTGGGMFTYWNTSNPPDLSTISSVLSSHISPTGHETGDNLRNNEAPRMVAALKETETLFIDVRKTGLVTFNGNSTLVTLSSNDFFQHLELKKYGDGFLYNALFPEDQLSQIDLFNPLKSLNQQNP